MGCTMIEFTDTAIFGLLVLWVSIHLACFVFVVLGARGHGVKNDCLQRSMKNSKFRDALVREELTETAKEVEKDQVLSYLTSYIEGCTDNSEVRKAIATLHWEIANDKHVPDDFE